MTTEQVVIVVGQTRIRDKKQLYNVGTIEYDGSVDGYAGRYYGVVWDDVERGKHDGSILIKRTGQIKRYFRAPHPTAGSFVRPKLVDFGRPLSRSVILERYKNKGNNDDDDDDAKADNDGNADQQDEQHTVQTVLGNTKPIEFVGRSKILNQQRWSKLYHMSLRYMGICSIVENSQEFMELQHLLHLDLAGNLLSNWCDVFPHLLNQFPNLQHLSLAKNRFVDTTIINDLGDSSSSVQQSFPNLKCLNLRDCNINTFRTVLTIARRFAPNLRELCCAYCNIANDIVTFTATEAETDNANNIQPALLLSNLRVLDVTQCGFESEEQLEALALHCPNLVSLSLNHNPLISFPTNCCTWSNTLQELQLDHTQFKTWKSLRPIVQLHELKSLRFSSSALSTTSATTIRMNWIAAIPSLQQYQSSTITDRKEMEQQYVLLMVSAVKQEGTGEGGENGDDKAEEGAVEGLLLPQDERYQELLKKCADLVERKRATSNSSAAGDGSSGNGLYLSMVTVHIQSYCPSSCTMPPLIRKLPLRLTLSRLKALCARHFDIDVDLQHLQWKQYNDKSSFPIDLPTDGNNETTTLQDCGIVDGAEILVKERDLSTTAMTSKNPGQQQQHINQNRGKNFDNDNDRQALLDRIRKQEQERYDFDKRKAAAAGGGRSIVPTMTPIPMTATATSISTTRTQQQVGVESTLRPPPNNDNDDGQ